MQFFGLGAVVALLPVFAWSLMMVINVPVYRLVKRAAAWLGGSVLAAAALSCLQAPLTWPIPNGLGGVFGDLILKFPALFIGHYPDGVLAVIIGIVCAVPALGLLAFAANLIHTAEPEVVLPPARTPLMPMRQAKSAQSIEPADADEADSPFAYLHGYMTHSWYSLQARLRRLTGRPARKTRHDVEQPYDLNDDDFGLMPVRAADADRLDPNPFAGDRKQQMSPLRRIISAPHMDPDIGDDDDLPLELDRHRPEGILTDDDDDGEAGDWDVKPDVRAPQRVGAPPRTNPQ
eukprot:gene11930-15920_t